MIILDRINKLPLKQKYPIFFVLGFFSLVAIYIFDVWLIGTIAAHTTAIFFAGAENYDLAKWYFQHPFSVALAWLKPSHTLSNPEVRNIWALLNLMVFLAAVVFFVRDRFFDYPTDYRDLRKIRFKKVNFKLSKELLKTAKNKYFLGLSDRRRQITLPAAKMTEHIHILGGSGSGKTSFAIIPLCIQAIRKGNALVSIDFKGDKQAIHLLAREAKAAGKKFYLFSLNSSVKSNTYNPLSSGSILSKVERIMTALELIYTGSAKFYSYVQQSTFYPLMKSLEEKEIKYTLANIHLLLNNPKLLEDLINSKINEGQIKGLTAALLPYAELPQINDPIADIDLQKILEGGHVCYFDLQSAEVPQLSAALGKMIAMDIQALAGRRNQLSSPAVIAIDEFQNMACEAFTNIISKLRSANIPFILSNQAMGDLAAVSSNFLNTIVTNTATKLIFNVEDSQDLDYFARRGGHILQEIKSKSRGKTHQSTNKSFEEMFNLGNFDYQKRDNISENKSEIETYLIHPNVIISLPFGKSLIFRRGAMVELGNHVHSITKKEKDFLETATYPEIESPKKDMSCDKFSEFIEQKKQEVVNKAPVNKNQAPKNKNQDFDYSVLNDFSVEDDVYYGDDDNDNKNTADNDDDVIFYDE